MPFGAGIYYFEIEVVDKGRNGYVGIGFSAPTVPLNRLPGWEPAAYGYHGDDGCIFYESGKGQQYGPTFGKGIKPFTRISDRKNISLTIYT